MSFAIVAAREEELMETADIVAIEQVLALYGHAVDGDLSLLDEVFTEGAVFDVRLTGWGLIEGREAIRAWFELGKPPHPPSHHLTNVYAYEADGETRARSKWLFVNRKTDTVVSGDYNDTLVHTPQGWRIAHRSLLIRHPENYRPSSPGPILQNADRG